MSEPKRWVMALDPMRPVAGDRMEFVAAEDYDRLREERDRLRIKLDSWLDTVNAHSAALCEARESAAQLAEAVRPCVEKLRTRGNEEPREVAAVIADALAVFDAKEKE